MKLGRILAFLFMAYMFICMESIRLGKEEEKLLKFVVAEFERSPENGRFDRVIEMPHSSAKLIPKIFLWCPIRHFALTVCCPVHGCPLSVGKWTDTLDGSRADPRNPRLIYDLNGNLILVQAFYKCSELLSGLEKPGHSYLSASNEILELLPSHISRIFPIIMRQRSGFTVRLFDYVITGLYQAKGRIS